MLSRLSIRNFAVIVDTTIYFDPGLNALTGETGAGKSIVIDALGAVLGSRTGSDVVRSGASAATVEAAFDVDSLSTGGLAELLDAAGVELQPGEDLVLSREIGANGRSTARLAGKATTAAVLAEVGRLLVDIHGQSDHLSLLRPAAQLALLDRFAGTVGDVAEFGQARERWLAIRAQIAAHDQREREFAQRLDLLRFQHDELQAAEIQPGEDEALANERGILANAEQLLQAAAVAEGALAGRTDVGGEDSGALDRVRAAVRAVADIVEHDASANALFEQLQDALFALEDVGASLRTYAEGIELDPQRLSDVDERLELLRGLKRKYGPTLADVLQHAEDVHRELAGLESEDVDIETLHESERLQREHLHALARKLSDARQAAAGALSTAVEQATHELNMGRAAFGVEFAPVPGGDVLADDLHIDASGTDRVTFMLAANAGEELRPLSRVASGGETARLMLALKSILSDADETPTLVFDEIDVGVGGRSGQVVGEKLWGLTLAHQAIVISHLPQIAAFANRHVILEKSDDGGRTVTTAREISGDERVEELAAMFDGLPPTDESRANARALLERVEDWKTARTK